MNKHNQYQIYLVSLLFSCFYLIMFTSSFYAKQSDTEIVEQNFFEFKSKPADNEFPHTVSSIANEDDGEGFTVLEWEDPNLFSFLDNISELFNFNIEWPNLFGIFDSSDNRSSMGNNAKEQNKTPNQAHKTQHKAIANKSANINKPKELAKKKVDTAILTSDKKKVEVIELNSSKHELDAEVIDFSREYVKKDK